MGYLKNKTFGFYLSFVAAILALIGFVMYRQSGHTESYIEVLLLVTVVLQILAMIVLKEIARWQRKKRSRRTTASGSAK